MALKQEGGERKDLTGEVKKPRGLDEVETAIATELTNCPPEGENSVAETDTEAAEIVNRITQNAAAIAGGDENGQIFSGAVDLTYSYLAKSDVRDLLKMGIGSNITMDYSRINLTETLLAFNFDKELAVQHWRMARIMDGITVCAKEFGICDGIGPMDVPGKIYAPLMSENGVKKKNWQLRLPNIHDEEGDKIIVHASLEDFSHFMGIYEANKGLGDKRFPWKELVYNYFTGRKLNFKEKVGEGDDQKEVIKDLSIETPRDDYADFYSPNEKGEKGIDQYKKGIKKYKSGLQLMESFRYKSANHRENAGHAFFVKLDDGYSYIPLSGRMASEITAGDMRKNSEKGTKGHPHEVGEIDEENGVVVRFRGRDLTQRQKIVSAGEHKATNDRFLKMASGLASDEREQTESINVEGQSKTVIYLGGQFKEVNNRWAPVARSSIIKGIHHTYDNRRVLMGLPALSDEQASDIFVTDVIAPLFLNNPRDWLMCLAANYRVSGMSAADARTGIINSMTRSEWDDFELRIVGKDRKDGKIKELSFTGFAALNDYIRWRYKAGDVDQNLEIGASPSESKPLADKTPEQITAIKKIFADIFGDKYEKMMEIIREEDKPTEMEVELPALGTTFKAYKGKLGDLMKERLKVLLTDLNKLANVNKFFDDKGKGDATILPEQVIEQGEELDIGLAFLISRAVQEPKKEIRSQKYSDMPADVVQPVEPAQTGTGGAKKGKGKKKGK